jgi:hypothetical protein
MMSDEEEKSRRDYLSEERRSSAVLRFCSSAVLQFKKK